ncbi:MAG: TapB family protein [Flavobacteriales bacterium]
MKLIITLLLCFIIMTLPITAQESCSKYYTLEEGADFQYANYGKNGNRDGSINYKVHNVTYNDMDTEAWMKISYKDVKGKEYLTSDYNFNCIDNVVEIDYESMISSETLKQYKGKKMDISGSDIVFPNDMSVGQKLDDASVTMKMDVGGTKMNFQVDLINRSVEKKEAATTPAGTFDCYVIYGDRVTKQLMQQTSPSRLWLAEGVGMIKQETYDKGGKLMNSIVLTQYSN